MQVKFMIATIAIAVAVTGCNNGGKKEQTEAANQKTGVEKSAEIAKAKESATDKAAAPKSENRNETKKSSAPENGTSQKSDASNEKSKTETKNMSKQQEQKAETTKDASNESAEAAQGAEKAPEKTTVGGKNESGAKKTVSQETQNTPKTASSAEAGAKLYGKCVTCHGKDGKTKALGKSAIIAGQKKEDLVEKIKGYRAGTLNVAGMGTLMKGQVGNMSDEDINTLADYIAGLK